MTGVMNASPDDDANEAGYVQVHRRDGSEPDSRWHRRSEKNTLASPARNCQRRRDHLHRGIVGL
jgi:hypothetical protein